ncbi:10675_t:CDS:2, partial [Racocetra persica]
VTQLNETTASDSDPTRLSYIIKRFSLLNDLCEYFLITKTIIAGIPCYILIATSLISFWKCFQWFRLTIAKMHHQYGDKLSVCYHRALNAPSASGYQPLSTVPRRIQLSFITDKSPSRIIKTKQGCEIKLKRITESEKYIRKSVLSSYEAVRPTISSWLRPNRMVEIGNRNLVLVPSERYLTVTNGKVDCGLNKQ